MVKTIVETQRSLFGAIGGYLVAAGLAVITLMLASDEGVPTTASWIVSGVGGILVAAFLSLGHRLGATRGGIFVDESGGRLGLGLTGIRDVWWIPLADIRGVANARADIRRTEGLTQSWSVQIERHSSLPISLFETTDFQRAEAALEAIAAVGPWEVVPQGEAGDMEFEERALRFGVHRHGALQLPIALFGLSLLIVGVGFFVQLDRYVVLGLFFAPVLALIGAVLLSVWAVKRFGYELLEYRDGVWTHSVRYGPFSWGRRAVMARQPSWRVKVHSLRGASLELVGDDGIHLLASGATTRSRLSVEELVKLPGQFAKSHPPDEPSPPPRV